MLGVCGRNQVCKHFPTPLTTGAYCDPLDDVSRRRCLGEVNVSVQDLLTLVALHFCPYNPIDGSSTHTYVDLCPSIYSPPHCLALVSLSNSATVIPSPPTRTTHALDSIYLAFACLKSRRVSTIYFACRLNSHQRPGGPAASMGQDEDCPSKVRLFAVTVIMRFSKAVLTQIREYVVMRRLAS